MFGLLMPSLGHTLTKEQIEHINEMKMMYMNDANDINEPNEAGFDIPESEQSSTEQNESVEETETNGPE